MKVRIFGKFGVPMIYYILLIDVALFVFPCTRFILMVMFRMPVWGLQPKERLCNFIYIYPVIN